MAPRLSEILERIRPAGAPGAPTEGEFQHRLDRRADEIATLTAVLASFEAEADAVVARARAEADRLRSEAQRRVHEIAASLPDRVAVAEARAAHLLEERDQVEHERIRSEAAATISNLQARAEVQIPALVEEAMAMIWSQVPSGPEAGSPP